MVEPPLRRAVAAAQAGRHGRGWVGGSASRLRDALAAVAAAVLVATTLVAQHPPVAAQTPTDASGSGLVVVELRAGTTTGERDDSMGALGLELVDHAPGSRFVLARLPAGSSDLEPLGAVIGLHEPVVVHATSVPNDPLYRLQWNLTSVQAERAWDVSTGAGAVVAVVDTGVAPGAPDLAGTAMVPGYDWVDDDSEASDSNGHGTHVAGIIAQRTNNATGVAGLAHDASIMPLRALDAKGAGLDYDVASAILFAAGHGADVINLSLGSAQGSLVLQSAVATAALQGVTIVAAAGNDGRTGVSYPAAYSEVIAVGAVRADRQRAPYSNTGPDLELAAPGGDLSVDQNSDGYGDGVLAQTLSTTQPGQYCYCFYQGTSMAAPHVSATAALIAATGVTDPDAIRTAMTSTALDLGTTGRDAQFGYGLVRAFDALVASQQRAPEPAPAPGLLPLPDLEPAPLPALPATPTPDPLPLPSDVRSIDGACPVDRVPSGQFDDVSAGSVHAPAIDCAAWYDIARGTSSTTYSPAMGVTRDQMASFLARLIEHAGYDLPASPPDAFDDDGGNAHEHRINQLAATGVVKGDVGRDYRPSQPVTRAAMASFLARAHDLVAAEPLPPGPDAFDDDTGNVHEEQIDRVAAAGIAAGTSARAYSPSERVTRAQLATFLMRTLDLLIADGDAPPP